MNILIISVVTPFPIDSGGNAGTFKLINESRKNHDITFISLPSTKEKIEGLKDSWKNVKVLTKEIEPVKISLKRKLINNLKKLNKVKANNTHSTKLLLNNTDLVNSYFESFLNDVKELLNNTTFDLIQVEFIEIAPIVNFLPKETPKIFVHHELRYQRMQFEYDLMPTKLASDYWRIQNTKDLEIAILKKYDKVLTVSELDSERLVNAGLEKEKLRYSPLPVNVQKKNINLPFNFTNRLVFLGPEEHYPNEDGLRWFLEEIWEGLGNNFPELSFEIVGKWKEETKRDLLKNQNITFLGYVQDLKDVFEGAILVVPLRIGGGMKMKILEAISWNTPIITTTIGAEGLPLVNKKNCFVADNLAEFSEAILFSKKNKEELDKVTLEARNIIRDQFSIENCLKIRENSYSELVNNKLLK